EQAELARAREAIEAERRAATEARERAEAEERAIQARKRREVEVFARELRRRGEEAERRAAEAIRDAVERLEKAQRTASAAPRLRTEAVKAIRDARAEVLKDPELQLPEEEEAPSAEPTMGARVRVRRLGLTGELIALHEDGEAEVAIGGKRLRVPKDELAVLAGPAPSAKGAGAVPRGIHSRAASGGLQGGATQHPRQQAAGGERSGIHSRAASGGFQGGATQHPPARMEINLVGLTVEEALPRVDKLLDVAALADRHQVRVIHGFGQGRLRKAVADLLRGHPHVAAWRAGEAGEGGGGVTVVELKE
ncbi:MAG TPA: Smr/MutS family protein, partial [Vicinamibacteria bacterium]|nr:Smr/MutS family protein [Vicinamibacteria bacterium]